LLNSIGLAVIFTILLVTANTMSMAVRERRTEIAVLKTLGFTSRQVMGLILAEALTIGALGGGIGLGLSVVIMRVMTRVPATGVPENAMVVQRGSASELTSWVPLDHRNKIVVDPRVAVASDGRPMASPEIVVVGAMPRRTDGLQTNVTIRGVTPKAFEVRGGIEIKQGRNFQPGIDEI